jgi:hypothetical protein
MDLPEFLLARADDLDPLHGRLSDDLPHHPYCGGMTADDDCEYSFRPDLCDCGWPERVLASCAALRAIVKLHRHEEASSHVPRYEDDEPFGCVICAQPTGSWITWPEGWCLTLRLLAQPYADHPVFDPAWRV